MSVAFTPTQVPHAGQRVRGYSTTCGDCGVFGGIPANGFKTGGGNDDEKVERFARQKFERLGWKIGRNEKENRCPGCFNASKNAAEQKRKNLMSESQIIPMRVKADDPTPMSREDRRIVFEKLNEVYADEKTGYSAGWTDAKVADDLGVPRAWVKQVRDEMFGPEGSNEQIRQAMAEARDILAESKKIGPMSEQILTSIRALLAKADKIERAMVEIDKSLR